MVFSYITRFSQFCYLPVFQADNKNRLRHLAQAILRKALYISNLDNFSAQDDLFDDRGLVAVWDESQRRNGLGDYQIRLLSDRY